MVAVRGVGVATRQMKQGQCRGVNVESMVVSPVASLRAFAELPRNCRVRLPQSYAIAVSIVLRTANLSHASQQIALLRHHSESGEGGL